MGYPVTLARRLTTIAAHAAALLVAAAGAPAQPVEPPPGRADYDDQEAETSDFWERVLDPASDRYDDLVERAVALLREGDRASLVQAGQLLQEAVRLSPNRPLAHLWHGRLADRQGAYPTCAQSIAVALDLDPGLSAPGGSEPAEWAAPYELAVCRARAGKYEAAIEGLRRLLGRAQGQPAVVHQRLGECYMALGRLDEAIESFRQGFRQSPYSADLGFALAVAYDRAEDAAQARDVLGQALARDPRAGSLAGANRIWIPSNDAHYYLGLATLGGEDAPRAVLHFRRYRELAGETEWSRRARLHYEEALGRAVAGQGLEMRGSATVDDKRAGRAIAKSDAALQTCLRKTPDLLLRVSITVVLPSKGKAAQAVASTARPGVRVAVQEPTKTPAAEAQGAVECAESVARRIKLPRPVGAPGTYVTAEFGVVAR